MTEITELVELDPDRLDGVGSPANGTSFLILKAKAPEAASADVDADGDVDADDADAKAAFAENAQRVKQGKKPKAKKDAAEKSDSKEADEIEEQMTGEAAKSYCGDPECDLCVKAELVPLQVRTTLASGVSKATLRAADRKKMPESSFAYVDSKGEKHLPIHDPEHVQAALGRFGQQDFSDADNPDDAKRKAARKILAAAKEHNVDVGDDTDVARAAKDAAEKGQVQDALQGTKAPEIASTLDGGRSGLVGPATAGVKDVPITVPDIQPPTSRPGPIGRLDGGESAYEIPAEQGLGATNGPGPLAAKELALASLASMMNRVEQERRAAKDGGWLQVPGPTADQAAQPGSMPWESYDAATLDQVAGALAACCNAIESIATREQIEALSGDSGDAQDAWDLNDASSCLEYAMGVVARLAYAEQAEYAKETDPHLAAVEKAYRRLRSADEKALRDAHAALSNVLAEHDRKVADAGQSEPSEGDKIQMELTKEELAEQISASIDHAFKSRDKAAAKVAKDARKAQKKAAKQAKKNANNGGDITAQQMQDTVGAPHDADDGSCVGGRVDPQYVNKSEDDSALKSIQDQLKAATDQIGALGGLVEKMAKRPRQGGPVLDGQARGQFPATESRMTDGSQVSDADRMIKSLEERYETAPTALAKQEAGHQLTYARLRDAIEAGRL